MDKLINLAKVCVLITIALTAAKLLGAAWLPWQIVLAPIWAPLFFVAFVVSMVWMIDLAVAISDLMEGF